MFGVLLSLIEFAVLLQGFVDDFLLDGLTLAVMRDVRADSSTPPRIYAVRGSGAGGGYLRSPSFRISLLPTSVRRVSCEPGAGGCCRRLWIFNRGNRGLSIPWT
jgi:hypothetical protein